MKEIRFGRLLSKLFVTVHKKIDRFKKVHGHSNNTGIDENNHHYQSKYLVRASQTQLL